MKGRASFGNLDDVSNAGRNAAEARNERETRTE